MNSKFRIANAVFIFCLVLIGNILNITVGIYADLLFMGSAIIIYSLIIGRKKNWDLDEKYRNIKYAEKRYRYGWLGLMILGVVCAVCGVIMYFDEDAKWVLALMVILVILIIPMCFIDRKFWAQVPREDRPWAYRGIKTKGINTEEQEEQ